MSTRNPDPLHDPFIEALIIRNSPFGEGHRLLTLVDRHKGKVSVMAFGAGKEKSTRRSSLLVGHLIRARVKRKNPDSPWTLQEVSVAREYPAIRKDLARMAQFYLLIEVLDVCLEEGTLLDDWDSLPALLAALENDPGAVILVYLFLFGLLRDEGVFPHYSEDLFTVMREFGYSSHGLGNGTTRFLHDSEQHPDPAYWQDKRLSASVLGELQDILSVTVSHHFQRTLKSLDLLHGVG